MFLDIPGGCEGLGKPDAREIGLPFGGAGGFLRCLAERQASLRQLHPAQTDRLRLHSDSCLLTPEFFLLRPRAIFGFAALVFSVMLNVLIALDAVSDHWLARESVGLY